mgnify:CR=1 FL=1
MAKAKHQSLKEAAKPANRQLKRAMKSANKGAKSASTKSKVSNIKEHIEKLSGDRRDCFGIWMLIKHDSSIYKTDEEIINLIKAKGYETLLGEIS